MYLNVGVTLGGKVEARGLRRRRYNLTEKNKVRYATFISNF